MDNQRISKDGLTLVEYTGSHDCSYVYPEAEVQIEGLLATLKEYTLDPTFEKYGYFSAPNDCKDSFVAQFKHCFFGNFADLSYVFNIVTNDDTLIKKLDDAIRENQKTPSYANAVKKLKERAEKEEAEKKQRHESWLTRNKAI